MTALAYYNEIDPHAAQWLRNLIAAGHIAPGVVDERSIEDVVPDELWEFTQCHFFAGIGGWSIALRRAGWPDDRPIWTGSAPCQPFSAAGSQAGFADDRHLWPHFAWLIAQCRPPVIAGEQVASKAAEPWIDHVQDDLEDMGYAFGTIAFPAASVGAPHIRDRLYWVGHADESGSQGLTGHDGAAGWERPGGSAAEAGVLGGLADGDGCDQTGQRGTTARGDGVERNSSPAADEPPTGPVNGFWGSADWLFCRDGKWRSVEPSTFPLAHGLPRGMGSLLTELQGLAELDDLDGESLKGAKNNRLTRLKGYGNAINVEAAKVFIECIS